MKIQYQEIRKLEFRNKGQEEPVPNLNIPLLWGLQNSHKSERSGDAFLRLCHFPEAVWVLIHTQRVKIEAAVFCLFIEKLPKSSVVTFSFISKV